MYSIIEKDEAGLYVLFYLPLVFFPSKKKRRETKKRKGDNIEKIINKVLHHH